MNIKEKIQAKIRHLPSLPASSARLIQMLQDPEINIQEITQFIELDPGLTSNILRLANSAYFGCARTISSVREAFIRLGSNNIFQLIVTLAVAPIAKQELKGYDLPPGQLWEHSVAVALGTDKLSELLQIQVPIYAFTAGLLHDIGKIALATFVDIDSEKIRKLAYESKVSFEQAEQEIIGIDHAEVGAFLLETWNIPSQITEVVRYHHNPEGYKGETPVTDLVHISDSLCYMSGIGTGIDGLNYKPSEVVYNRFKLKQSHTENVVCNILSELNEMRNLFNIDYAGR